MKRCFKNLTEHHKRYIEYGEYSEYSEYSTKNL